MLKKMFFIAGLLMAAHAIQAQDVLLSQDWEKEKAQKPTGANEKNFLHFFTSYGLLLGPDEGIEINLGRSTFFAAGIRYKHKLNGMFSLGLEPGYELSTFSIAQKDAKAFPDTLFWSASVKHLKEKMVFQSFGLGGFFRINFDPKRGNFMGYYLDLGAAAKLGWMNYTTKDKRPDGTIVKTEFSRLPYTSALQYNTFAKLGFDWLALGFSYRLSDYFKPEYDFPELPRYAAFLELNLYKH